MVELAETGAADPGRPFTALRIAGIGAAILVVAFAIYWFALRTTFAPVLTSLPPEDAADVVKVLDEKKIVYRLADGGTTVLVASDQADKARVELVGSELPMRGQVGFELFNQSDMGLTEFAQKINYQRALQGELARTLLMLDGIQSVRVHLGLADRSLFRDEQSRPKASVTLVLKPGHILTESRVSGIQRLVAGAIPDLQPEAVAVLDETGKVVSRIEAAIAPATSASEARLQLHRATIAAALRRAHPGRQFGITVSLQLPAASDRSDGESGDPLAGDSVKVLVTTLTTLDAETQRELTREIETAIGLDAARVAVSFQVGDPALSATPAEPLAAATPRTDQVVAKSTRGRASDDAAQPLSPWWLLVPLAVAAIFVALWSDRRRRRRDRQGLESFTQQLRERLAAMPEAIG